MTAALPYDERFIYSTDAAGRRRRRPLRTKLFDELCAHPYGRTTRELIEHVYKDREDGGPLNANLCIHLLVMKMNREWKKRGELFRIHAWGGPGSRYQIWLVREKRCGS